MDLTIDLTGVSDGHVAELGARVQAEGWTIAAPPSGEISNVGTIRKEDATDDDVAAVKDLLEQYGGKIVDTPPANQ